MPTELVRVNLDLIYPPFVERMLTVLDRCKARGCQMYWTSGTRYWDEQTVLRQRYLDRLHLESLVKRHKATDADRAKLAGILKLGGGRASAPGFSAHQFGLAADCTHDSDINKPGLQPDWNPKNYKVYLEELKKADLVSGAHYGDLPHANWPGFSSSDELAPLRLIWRERLSLPPVWKYVDNPPPEP